MKKAIIHTEKGDMTVEFYHKDAPKTVENFIKLIEDGFYNGLTFHRFIPNFLIALMAAKTSSDNNKLFALEIPLAKDENKTHLTLMLLSPLTVIFFLKLFILFLNINDDIFV